MYEKMYDVIKKKWFTFFIGDLVADSFKLKIKCFQIQLYF